MKTEIERRKPEGFLDYISLAITTFGVGYMPLAPGTWGSMVGVGIYFGVQTLALTFYQSHFASGYHSSVSFAIITASVAVSLGLFSLVGIWASGRSIPLLGNHDPSEAVVDEVIGQLIVFLFIPFGIDWSYILAGFLLFRVFDIWKPYPIDSLQNLPAGIGVCADDILAGVYAGVCLAIIYAVSISI